MSTATFACTWEGCSKEYTRRDHLERHERNHSGEARSTCHICSRQYIRSDILARHLVTAHGQPAPNIGRPRKHPCTKCKARQRHPDGSTTFSPCTKCLNITASSSCSKSPPHRPRSASPDLPPTFDFQHAFTQTPGQASGQTLAQTHHVNFELPAVPQSQFNTTVTSTSYVPFNHSSSHLSFLSDTALTMAGPINTNNASQAAYIPTDGGTQDLSLGSGTVLIPPTSANPLDLFADIVPRLDPSPNWMENFLRSATTDHQFDFDIEGQLGPVSGNPAALMQADWGFTDIFDLDFFEAIGTHARGSPERDADLVLAVEAEEMDGLEKAKELPDGQPQSSAWPTVYKPTTPEWQLALPRTRPTVIHPPSLLAPRRQVHERARTIMTTLIEHSHRQVWPLPDLGDFPSTDALTRCMNLYLGHFAGWLPVVDCPRGSFKIDKAAPLLLMSMAAVGSVYERGELSKLGLPLNELVRRVLLFITEHDRRFAFQTSVVQSALLQAYFGMYSGSPKLFQQTEVTRAFLVAAAKRMNLLRTGASAVEELKRTHLDPSAADVIRAEKQDDRRLRLGWSIFIFDAQLACLLEVPSQYTMFEVLAPLAGDLDARPFPEVMKLLLDEGRLPENISDFGLSIIAYTLYRLCLDAASIQFGSTQPGPYKYNLDFSRHKRHPQALLDTLASHCLASAHTPTSLLTSCICLAQHSHLQFTRVGFLSDVMAAAGKLGTVSTKESAKASLCSWLADNPLSGRNILAHAAVLICLLDRFKFDTPVEVVWMFHAALCLWACINFSPDPFPCATSTSTNASPISISWTSSSELDGWIETGGRLVVQGIGAITKSGLSGIMQQLSGRLEVVSWGLAEKYRMVLLDLMLEET